MKKMLLGLAVACVTFFAKAEYLSWCVDTSSTAYDAGYNRAKLVAVDTSSSAATTLGYLTNVPGSTVTDLSAYYSDSYSYYIEAYNYSSYSSGDASTYKRQEFTYSDLVGSSAVLSDWTAMTSVASAWNGSKTVATPEPTSGLLMLMGFAMLGLKRKKEV